MSNKSHDHQPECRSKNAAETSEFLIDREFRPNNLLFCIAFAIVVLSLPLHSTGHPYASFFSSLGVAVGFLGQIVSNVQISKLSIKFGFR